ncbi:unnamed protein product [Rangifer tarandus platyrhynchus]|uniref:Uncharacterized protein n=1 Tax=Rangifer tarandus platyrhynchus TaxID=3082113 RepID=A0AC59Y0T1_RANTA
MALLFHTSFFPKYKMILCYASYLKLRLGKKVCVCVCVHSLVDFLFWVAGEPVIRLGDSQATQSKGLLDLWGLRTVPSSFYSILMSFLKKTAHCLCIDFWPGCKILICQLFWSNHYVRDCCG